MQVKAMVAKVDKDNNMMVVFTDDRQFIRLPLTDPKLSPGSVIWVNLPRSKKLLLSGLNGKWFASAAVLVLLFAIGLFSTFWVSPVSAYITLDMKPSVQLSIDDKGKIKSVMALNENGKQLANSLDVENMDIYEGVRDIIKKTDDLGYLESKNENLVMACVTKMEYSAYQVDENKLRTIIHDQLSYKKYPGYVVVNNADKSQLQRAENLGCTVNQLILSEQASERGIDINVETINGDDLMSSIKESKTSVPTLFPENNCEVTWQGSSWNMQQQDISQPSTGTYNSWQNEALNRSLNKGVPAQTKEGLNQASPEHNPQGGANKSYNNYNEDCETPNQSQSTTNWTNPLPNNQQKVVSPPAPAYPPNWNGHNSLDNGSHDMERDYTSNRNW